MIGPAAAGAQVAAAQKSKRSLLMAMTFNECRGMQSIASRVKQKP